MADARQLPLEGVTTVVEVDRSGSGPVTLRTTLTPVGERPTDEHRQILRRSADGCPVRQTLPRGIAFERTDCDP